MKSLFSLLLFVLISFYSNAQIVAIPDANFKAALIAGNIDLNGDGEIQESEAELVDELFISQSNISDLTGIASFTNLNYLNCSNNQLASLNVSGLTNLNQMYCSSNNLTELDVSDLTNLWNLQCQNNQLLSLDVSGLNILTDLGCQNNQLTSLNITNCPNLFLVDGCNNNITSLDFTGAGTNFLADFLFSNNSISSLVFPNGFEFSVLYLDGNQIVDLDLSNITSYPYVYENPIETINIKNGVDDYSFYMSIQDSFNSLQFVCADEIELESITNLFNGASIDAIVSSYCTFEPGGDYNRITGSMRLDLDSNGCDATDALIPNVLIEINDGIELGFVSTNQIGDYNAYTAIGDYTIKPNIENVSWYTVTPNSASVSFVDNNNLATQYFCVKPLGIHQDVEVIMTPIFSAQSGFDARYKIVFKNKGTQIVSGDIELIYDDAVLDYEYSSEGIANQTTGSLVWDYTNLNPFESRSFTVTFNVNSPMESPAVNIDDQLDFMATINPTASDESPSDNVFSFKDIVVGSYDPNDITCLEGNTVSPDKIGEYLHYNINFENTGTAAATFVVVKDEIDETKYDLSSLQIMYASHNMQTQVNGNKIEFIFDNINLGPSEKGNVVFKIKTNNSLIINDSVANEAEIFFDYNFPIETNMAVTSFQVLSVDDFGIDNSISVFPNPAKDLVTLKSKNSLKSIKVYDAMSRLVFEASIDDSIYKIDVSDYANGIYFLKMKTELGEKVERFIKN